jgi:chromosome segregation ATPase
MLDARVATLEADMREVKSTLGRIEPLLRSIDERLRKLEIDVSEMKGKVSQLPTAWTFITSGIGLVLGTFAFIFAVLRFALPQ